MQIMKLYSISGYSVMLVRVIVIVYCFNYISFASVIIIYLELIHIRPIFCQISSKLVSFKIAF